MGSAATPSGGLMLPGYYWWSPSRRAERARCRLDRSRRSRLTSIGSWATASGRSISALSTW